MIGVSHYSVWGTSFLFLELTRYNVNVYMRHIHTHGLQWGSGGKESACNVRDPD